MLPLWTAEIRAKRRREPPESRMLRSMRVGMGNSPPSREQAAYETIMNVLPAVGAQEQNGNIEGFSRSSQFRVSLVE